MLLGGKGIFIKEEQPKKKKKVAKMAQKYPLDVALKLLAYPSEWRMEMYLQRHFNA